MTATTAASREEFSLFNPAFVALLISESAREHAREAKAPSPLPVGLASATIAMYPLLRGWLPSSTRSHLSKWMADRPEFRPEFQRLFQGSLPPLRAGLLFGLQSQALGMEGAAIAAVGRRAQLPPDLSAETRAILDAARLTGRWFAKTGSTPTVLSLLGFTP